MNWGGWKIWGGALAGLLVGNLSEAFSEEPRDLLQKLTIPEKISLLINEEAAIPRLGIPGYDWWNEGLHGYVSKTEYSTTFAQAIGLAATFDEPLVESVATAVSTEGRAVTQKALRAGEPVRAHKGLTLWTPNANLLRDPRWGRGAETYGEDPLLVSRMATRYVRGIQGNDPGYLRGVATPKHFVAHNGPEEGRLSFNTRLTPLDLWDSELAVFRDVVTQGKPASIMTSYNALNGVPVQVSQPLLIDLLRGRWGFQGTVVTDCGAMGGIYYRHGYLPGARDREAKGVAAALRAGVDLECGNDYRSFLPRALQLGLISETDLDRSVGRVLETRRRLSLLGDQNPAQNDPYASIGMDQVESPKHHALALESARKSMVLLKNRNQTLPLDPTRAKRILVVGPHADEPEMLLGGAYRGFSRQVVTPLAALRKILPPGTRIDYRPLFPLLPPERAQIESASCRGITRERLPSQRFELATPSFFERSPGEPGLEAEYYSNQTLSGEPDGRRIDYSLQFFWKGGSPEAFPFSFDRDRSDGFSIRWRTQLRSPYGAGGIKAAFVFRYDDGARIRLNGRTILEDWKPGGARDFCFEVDLREDRSVPLEIEYFEQTGQAEARLFVQAPRFPSTGAVDEEALELAKSADAILAFAGLGPQYEAEDLDRSSLSLPTHQEESLLALARAVPDRPFILTLIHGTPVSLKGLLERSDAILDAFYPGQFGGTAIAEALVGLLNPGGKLPMTVYAPEEPLPALSDYSMENRTYRYFRGRPQFPFGYGLSYTRFAISDLGVEPDFKDSRALRVRARITNQGTRAGDEVVQLYLSDRKVAASVEQTTGRLRIPLQTLRGFQRLRLEPGESRWVEFVLSDADFALLDPQGRRWRVPETLTLTVSGGLPGALPETSGGQSTAYQSTEPVRPMEPELPKL